MKLSLRWKIAGGFSLVLVFIAILGWVTLSLFGSLRSVQRQVIDEAVPQLATADEIVRSFTAQSAAVRGYLIGSQGSPREQYQREAAAVEVVENEARRLFAPGSERRQLEQLIAAGRDFQQLVDDQVLPLAARGNRSQAFRVLSQEGSPLISEIETLGDLLRNAQEDKVVASELELQNVSNRFRVGIIVVLIGTLTAGAAVAIALPRRLVADLSTLVDAANAIGRGDLDQRLDIHSGDEVEELAERFEEMQAGLKKLQQLAAQDRELEIAASIQKNLLQKVPIAQGAAITPLQRQANRVGGDWYDVDYTGKTLTFAIGDASGKGIAAALMATVALSVLRAERGLGASPQRVIERANQALNDATDPDQFTTVVYAGLDCTTGEVRWLNMGHPAPFILPAAPVGEPRGYYLEGPRNRALGWFDDPGLAEAIVTMSPGDRLVLFTDGFLEAKSPQGEIFGENRFAEAIISHAALDSGALGKELVATVEEFAAGKLDDDLTMLVVEFQGPAAPAGGGEAT